MQDSKNRKYVMFVFCSCYRLLFESSERNSKTLAYLLVIIFFKQDGPYNCKRNDVLRFCACVCMIHISIIWLGPLVRHIAITYYVHYSHTVIAKSKTLPNTENTIHI